MGTPWSSRGARDRSREVVTQSWDRARSQLLDPESVIAPLRLDGDSLREYRDAHPLAGIMPVIRRLLVDDVDDAGLLVAVGDAAGRLLWVEGDKRLKSRAEGMLFVEGSDWSESAVGTSAPGTALQLDRGVQIDREEHFALRVQRWSCTAVPVHDLDSGRLIGVVDITGGAAAAAPSTLALVEASVAAAERELLIARLRSAAAPRSRRTTIALAPIAAHLEVLGRDTGVLRAGARSLELSTRHAEILALLAWHPAGLSAERLAELVYGREDATVTLRAEMVRLRRRLESGFADLVPLARPYRLGTALELDARSLVGLLTRGAHRAALAAWARVLPASAAPGIESIRAELEGSLRESMLECASADTLFEYASTDAAADDAEVWRTLLQLLPARSPRRPGVVAHLEELDSDAD